MRRTEGAEPDPETRAGGELLAALVNDAAVRLRGADSTSGVAIAEVIGLVGEDHAPLIRYVAEPGGRAIAARTIVDLHGAHIGRQVVVVFEAGNPLAPIVIGLLQCRSASSLPEAPGEIEVEADGERLLVTAREQLVLRCGKASITLTKAGKVLIEGTYVASRATGVNRLRGGSVEIN